MRIMHYETSIWVMEGQIVPVQSLCITRIMHYDVMHYEKINYRNKEISPETEHIMLVQGELD